MKENDFKRATQIQRRIKEIEHTLSEYSRKKHDSQGLTKSVAVRGVLIPYSRLDAIAQELSEELEQEKAQLIDEFDKL